MRRTDLRAIAAVVLAVVATGCSRKVDSAPPVATPSIALSRTEAAIGSPLDVTYKFLVSPTAPSFDEDYTVFVHFLDKDGELMWTDDHPPMPPTREWTRGATIQYTRTIFIPKFPYLGEAHVELGLYSPKSGKRLPMAGQDAGMRSYRVATFTMRPQPEDTFVVFKDGWHNTEMGTAGSGLEWQWSRKSATLTFRNPKRDAVLFLDCDQPVTALDAPQQVEVHVGEAVVDTFRLQPGRRELRRVTLRRDLLGAGNTVDALLSVDKTFVPSAIPQLKSGDTRELGIRVFRAYLQPE